MEAVHGSGPNVPVHSWLWTLCGAAAHASCRNTQKKEAECFWRGKRNMDLGCFWYTNLAVIARVLSLRMGR